MSQEPQGGGPVALEWPGDVRDLPDGGAFPAWLLAVAVLLVACTWFARRRGRAAAVSIAAAPTAPTPTAVALLQALAVPADAAALPAFVAEVKRLVRLHAHERFAVPAFVATSEELCRALPQAPGLAPCLTACDAALFGAVRLAPASAVRLRAEALAFAAGDAQEAQP